MPDPVGAPTLVLVHGAFRGAWSWQPVVDRLRARGVDVLAVDLLGAGDRWDAEAAPVTLDECAADLGEQVAALAGPVVLVGHSQGSLVVRALLASAPSNLVGVAHLDGAVPDAGECAADLLGAPPPAPDLLIAPPPPDPGLPEDLALLVGRSTRSQHAALAAGVVGPEAGSVPTWWAFCTETPDGYPSSETRRRLLARGEAFDWLASPHDAPLVAPDVVVDWLRRTVLAVDSGGAQNVR